MTPLLVTGFEPFGEYRVNSSERVVRALPARSDLVGAVLPVSFRRAETQLAELLESHAPRALLMLGLHGGSEMRLERVARNRDEAEGCDEDGESRAGRAISAAGPTRYASTLPLDDFAAALTRLSLPWTWSDDAGGFLCNHVFYRARGWIERSGRAIPCGFVHLPPLEALALERQVEGVEALVELI